MKYLFVIFIMLSSAIAKAEYQVDTGYYKLEHAWRGENNYAQFKENLFGVGVSYWHGSGIGARVGYIDGKSLNTEGKYYRFTLGLKYIASFELLYRYELFTGVHALIGLGTNIIPIPNISVDDPHHSNDYDNDEGYIFGLQYRITKHASIGWRFTHFSRIDSGKYDEWTKAHSLKFIYTF